MTDSPDNSNLQDNDEETFDPRIFAGLKELVDLSDTFTPHFPYYSLDFTWPSLSLFGLFGGSLINKRASVILSGGEDEALKKFNKQEAHLLLTISCYMAKFAADCWQIMDSSLNVKVRCQQNSEVTDIILFASSGQKIKGPLEFNVSEALREIITSPRSEIYYFEKASLDISPSSNFFGLFSYGLCSALSHYGEGAHAKKSALMVQEEVTILNVYLANSAFSNLERLYPEVCKNIDFKIFVGGAIFLPPNFNEDSFYARSVLSILEYLEEKAFSKKRLVQITLSIAKLADENIASAGFIISAALFSEMSKSEQEELFLLSDRFRQVMSNFPEILQATKGRLLKEKSWTELIKNGRFEEAKEIIKIDKKLGLLPLLRLKEKTIKSPEYLKLLKLINFNKTEESLEEIDSLIEQNLAELDIILLKAYIYFWLGDSSLALSLIDNIKVEDFKEDKFLLSYYYELKASLITSEEDVSKKKEFLKQSIKSAADDKDSYQEGSKENKTKDRREDHEISKLYLELFLLERREDNFENSWKLIDEALNYNPDNFFARARKVLADIEKTAINKEKIEFDETELFYLQKTNPAHPLSFTMANYYSIILKGLKTLDNKD